MDLAGKFDMFDLFTDGATTSPKTPTRKPQRPQPSLRGLRPRYTAASFSQLSGQKIWPVIWPCDPLDSDYIYIYHLFVWWWLNHPFSWYQPSVQEKDRTQLMLRTTMCASSKRNVNIPPPHPAPKTVYSTDISNRRYGKLPRIGTRRVLCTNCRFPSCNTYFRNQLSTYINCDTDTVISET